jgi:hypothetical protein
MAATRLITGIRLLQQRDVRRTLANASATRNRRRDRQPRIGARFNDYFALNVGFAGYSRTIGRIDWGDGHPMGIGQYLAVAAALAVFVAVLYAILSALAEREREAARKQWEADLRTRGA